jgi:hypothetical protein
MEQGGQWRLTLYPRRFSGLVRAASCITRHSRQEVMLRFCVFACLRQYHTCHDLQTESLQIPVLSDCPDGDLGDFVNGVCLEKGNQVHA